MKRWGILITTKTWTFAIFRKIGDFIVKRKVERGVIVFFLNKTYLKNKVIIN